MVVKNEKEATKSHERATKDTTRATGTRYSESGKSSTMRRITGKDDWETGKDQGMVKMMGFRDFHNEVLVQPPGPPIRT